MKAYINGVVTEIEIPEIKIDPLYEIQQLKQQLTDTDYIACKIAEGSATVEEYADIIADRQSWRKKINELEKASKEV